MPGAAELILIVEDERSLREPLEHLLRLRGFEVLCAEGATQALSLARGRRLAAAIVDLKLPEGSGRDVVAGLPAELPVIIFSATIAESGRLEISRPRTRLVEKPCSLTWLISTLHEMLQERGGPVLEDPLSER